MAGTLGRGLAANSEARVEALLCGAGPVSEPAWGGAGREGRAGRYHEHAEGPPVRALRVSPPVHHLGRHVLDGAAERVGPLVVVDGLLAQPEIWGRTAHSSAQSCSVWGRAHAEPHGGGLWCHLRRPACRGVTSPPALPGPHAPHDASGSPRLPGAPGDFPIGALQPSAGAPCKGTKRLNCLGTNRSPREAGRDREAGVPLDGKGCPGGEAGRGSRPSLRAFQSVRRGVSGGCPPTSLRTLLSPTPGGARLLGTQWVEHTARAGAKVAALGSPSETEETSPPSRAGRGWRATRAQWAQQTPAWLPGTCSAHRSFAACLQFGPNYKLLLIIGWGHE